MSRRALRWLGGGLLLAALGQTAHAQRPAPAGLAEGPYATMQARLERTVLKVDVLSLRIRVDQPTQLALRELAEGQEYTDERADRIARAVLGSEQALVHARFERDVPVAQFLDEAERQIGYAARAGLISLSDAERATNQLPEVFSAMPGDFADGDLLVYEIGPSEVRIAVRAQDGRAKLERVIESGRAGRTVLASYLAPGSPFREQLVRSLFE